MRTSGPGRGRRFLIRAAAVLLSVVFAVGLGGSASTVAHAAEGCNGRISSLIDLDLLTRIADSGHK
ncbi:MAG TPA: hypothetical protein VGM10_16790 [Actinocrinis sp.]|jgi:hypothetical protein